MKLATLLGAVILVGTGAVAAVPAQAALGDCPSDNMCIWENNNYSAGRDQRGHGQDSITRVSAALDNDMDSWANRSGTYGSCGWDGTNGTGDNQEWDATTRDNDVSVANSDEISSWRTRFGC